MKKILFLFSFLFLTVSGAFTAGLTARKVTAEAAEKETVEESIEYLEKKVAEIKEPSEKRSVYIFLGSLQELLSFFDDAQRSYVKAAGIAAGNGAGMPARSNEQIVLDAVRCALNNGDYKTADRYLNSAVKDSKKEIIQAYIKLYSQWSALCKAENVNDTKTPISNLESYLQIESMEVVKPAILLTLWYITGDSKYSDKIKTTYPDSVEMSVVRGDIQLLPTPFWFFLPKKSDTDFSSAETEIKDLKSVNTSKTESKVSKDSSGNSEEFDSKKAKWQLGFFQTEVNAQGLCNELKRKGFNPYIATEVRPSGTTYYQVIINEDKDGNMSDKIRNAGYDCCLLE